MDDVFRRTNKATFFVTENEYLIEWVTKNGEQASSSLSLTFPFP